MFTFSFHKQLILLTHAARLPSPTRSCHFYFIPVFSFVAPPPTPLLSHLAKYKLIKSNWTMQTHSLTSFSCTSQHKKSQLSCQNFFFKFPVVLGVPEMNENGGFLYLWGCLHQESKAHLTSYPTEAGWLWCLFSLFHVFSPKNLILFVQVKVIWSTFRLILNLTFWPGLNQNKFWKFLIKQLKVKV